MRCPQPAAATLLSPYIYIISGTAVSASCVRHFSRASVRGQSTCELSTDDMLPSLVALVCAMLHLAPIYMHHPPVAHKLKPLSSSCKDARGTSVLLRSPIEAGNLQTLCLRLLHCMQPHEEWIPSGLSYDCTPRHHSQIWIAVRPHNHLWWLACDLACSVSSTPAQAPRRQEKQLQT